MAIRSSSRDLLQATESVPPFEDCSPLPPRDALLRLPQVLSLLPISRSAWFKGVKDGLYPQGIKCSERVTAWSALEIYAFISSLKQICAGEAIVPPKVKESAPPATLSVLPTPARLKWRIA